MFAAIGRIGRMVLLGVLGAGCLLAAPHARAAEQVIDSGMAFYQPAAAAPRSLSWLKIVDLMNKNLADAQQVNIYSDQCHDGRLVELQADAKTKLTMPYVMGTATNLQQKSKDGFSNNDKNPPGRLVKHNTKDQVIADAFYYSYYAYLLSVPLSDSFLQQLITAYDGVSELPIEFNVPLDSSFRLALDDDMLFDPTFLPGEVGTGLINYVAGVVPEPLGGCIVALIAIPLLGGRGRSRIQ